MSTNAQVIGDALKLLGVIHRGGSLPPEEGADALRALNQMLERWTEDGIELGYFAQSDTTATCPIPAWAEQGVTSKLAQRLSADYPSSQLPAWVMNDDENGYATILRKVIVENAPVADMSHMPSGTPRGFTDITS
jgi:hypothetical protein